MAKSIFGSLLLKTQSSIMFADADSSNTVSLRAPATVGSNLTLTLPASLTASGVLSTDGSGNLSAALLVNANVSASAAIAYSKLALSDSIVNADINSAAAIAYSKLALTGSIVDADINASAAIAMSKLAALTASRAVVSDGSGVLVASATTSAEIDHLSGVTSSIQSQFSGKASTALSNLTVASLASQSLLVGSSSSAVASLAVGTNGQVLKVVGGNVAWAADSAVSSFKTDWETADTAVFAITHSLGTTDVKVEIYDIASGETIEVDSVVRTSVNVLTVTASEAPPAGGWRVLILAA